MTDDNTPHPSERLNEIKNGDALELKKRPRGILSHADREYLFGLREYEHEQSEANRKQEIRGRIQNALRDFRIIFALLENDERSQIFSEVETETLRDNLAATVAFIYLGLEQADNRMEEILERGLYFGANHTRNSQDSGGVSGVEVSMQFEYSPDPDTLYQRLKTQNEPTFTDAEIGVLVKSGKLDESDIKMLEGSFSESTSGHGFGKSHSLAVHLCCALLQSEYISSNTDSDRSESEEY